jgi:hypothetical protein
MVVCGLFICSCQPRATDAPQQTVNTNNTVATTAAANTNTEYTTTKTGKKIPIAEQGITIMFDDGWKKEDMDFHLDYCKQMMAGVKDKINADVFCPCFLDKIQYYYEPIYFKEAYEDQKKWNEACYQAATY